MCNSIALKMETIYSLDIFEISNLINYGNVKNTALL